MGERNSRERRVVEIPLSSSSPKTSSLYGRKLGGPGTGNERKESDRKMRGTRFSSTDFCSAKTGWLQKTCSRFIKIKRVHESGKIQVPVSQTIKRSFTSQCMDGKTRLIRSVLACPSEEIFPQIPSVQLEGKMLPVQGYAIRPGNRPSSFYSYNAGTIEKDGREGSSNPKLPRRLDSLGQKSRTMPVRGKGAKRLSGKPGFHDKIREIYPRTGTKDNMARNRMGYSSANFSSSNGSRRKVAGKDSRGNPSRSNVQEATGVNHRVNDICSSVAQGSQVQEVPSVTPARKIPNTKRQNETSTRTVDRGVELVANTKKRFSTSALETASSDFVDLVRRFRLRLGGSRPGGKRSLRKMGQEPETAAYQYKRIESSITSATTVKSRTRILNHVISGQCNNGVCTESMGVEEIESSSEGSRASVELSQTTTVESGSSPDPVRSERRCRRLVKRIATTRRMVLGQRHKKSPVSVDRVARSRPNGHPVQQTGGQVCINNRTSRSSGSRCEDGTMGEVEKSIHLSSKSDAAVDNIEDSAVLRESGANFSKDRGLHIMGTSNTSDSRVQTSVEPSGTMVSGNLDTVSAQSGEQLDLDCDSFLRRVLGEKYPLEVIENILKGKRESTRRQRSIAWKSFVLWMRNQDRGLRVDTSSAVMFLNYLLVEKGLAPGTIRTYKNSLSLPWSLIGINTKAWEFTELIRAAFLKKPPVVKRIPSWDLVKVLNFLESWDDNREISTFQLLQKAIFLTALASANRTAELAALDRSSMRWNQEGVTMAVKPGFLYKNQREGKFPPDIKIRNLPENQKLCPVRALQKYLERIPGNDGPVFRNSKSGASLTAASISSILCRVIEEADPGRLPRGHDLRRVATSLAWVRGLSPNEVCQRAFWASSSAFVSRYLCPNIPDTQSVALGTRANRIET